MVRSAGLLALVGVLLGGEVTPAVVDRVCAEAARLLPVDGIAVTVTAGGGQVTVGASDAVAQQVELAELTVGVGPCTQATRTGVTVAVNDVDDVGDVGTGLDQWPGWADQLSGVGVGAIAAAPLLAGPVTIGSLDVYRRHPTGGPPPNSPTSPAPPGSSLSRSRPCPATAPVTSTGTSGTGRAAGSSGRPR